MDPVSAGFTLDETKPIFTLAGESNATTTTDSYAFADTRSVNGNNEPMFSSAVPGFGGNDLLKMLSQQEPRIADTAPPTPYSSAADMEDLWSNIRLNRTEGTNDDSSVNNYFTGYNRLDSSSVWSDGVNNTSCNRNNDLMDSFDFLMKSLSSANNYVSMLTREQLSVLRSIRPSLLYELLQEVAKARSDRRMRRALPSECAFCKNNGENEECYSSHSLKDWRGRVLCPVLRAFRCPRCGATGDRAHTIKYCPEGAETGAGAGVNLASRRRMPPSSLLLGASTRQASTPTAPAASPVSSPVNTNLSFSSLWSNFSLN